MTAFDFPDEDIVSASGLYLPTSELLDEFAAPVLSEREVQTESGLWIPHAEAKEAPPLPDRRQPARGTAISLFSGCGGFDLGTTAAGFETRVFIEADKHACATLKHNAKAAGWDHAVILDCKIEKLTVEQVLIAARLDRGECDLLTGGFPCQPFSTASSTRKGTKDDGRGHLFYECARMIEGIRPKFFMLENVPGILTSSGGADIKIVCDTFADLGYDFGLAKLNAVNYGVPQDRKRIFFLGCRPDLGVSAITQLLGMVASAEYCDPETGLPTFQPVWKWTKNGLEQQNQPLPGQRHNVLRESASDTDDDDAEEEPLSLFGLFGEGVA